MTSKQFRYIMLLLGVVLTGASLPSDFSEKTVAKTEKILQKSFPEAPTNKRQEQQLIVPRVEQAHLYTINGEDSALAYAVLATVTSKSYPVTFLLILESDYTIHSLHLPNLKGSKNAPLKSKLWRKQFNGHKATEYTTTEITAISGATISSDAISIGVREILGVLTTQ